MSRWQHARSAAVGGAAVVVVWAVVALTAPAQHPQESASLTFGNLPPAPPTETEHFPPLNVPEGEIKQAQLLQRVPGAPGQPPRPAANVQDPAYPVVTVRVRVPADALDGENIKYVLTVQNVSAADAHSVSLRNPLTPEAAEFVSAKPMPNPQTDKQLVWNLGTLKAGASQSVEMTLHPKPGTKELKNLAYVRYEHGQAVTTKIGTPTIKVTKSAPKQTVRDEAYTVRVLVENQGKVPAEGVRIFENLTQSAEVEPITTGASLASQKEGQQWRWDLGRMLPGERRVIEYRVTARAADKVFTLTNVTGSKLVVDQHPPETLTEVLVPGLEMKFTGKTGNEVVKPGESAKYEIVVRNTGTLPSTNIKVTGSIPVNCVPTMKTNGGTVYRDSVVWQIPRLEPKESVSLRYAVKANTNGRWVLTARAADARGIRASQELATTFEGTAALLWETQFTPFTVQVGKEGTFTVNVKNVGGEVADKVRLLVDLPDNVDVTSSTPKGRTDNSTLQFDAGSIPANGERTYTLTFKGTRADQAWFKLRLTADCLGDRPMQTEKAVEVIGGAK